MDFQDLGQAIKSLRQQKGYSQQQLADDLRLSRMTINSLENARAGDVGVRKVMKILDYLGYELALREKSPFPTLEELRER
ncbi:Helix-turn-helix [Marinospirillum celere]|uniref:Helix-turn-helix n=1 Tax=Marinospirillum celere TaxID=1122252 RepID=A0A1I1E9Z8_9GAMM|nr:helix-turn-helix transcriptional regulator [Marinospirillum celere]SFB83944.1 Helix-turn-helix [Marinospirillum celere]